VFRRTRNNFFYIFSLVFAGSRGAVRYSIYSGDPNGFFSIDPVTGNIRVANLLDHETKSQVLLNIQATSGDPPSYGHTQVIYLHSHINSHHLLLFSFSFLMISWNHIILHTFHYVVSREFWFFHFFPLHPAPDLIISRAMILKQKMFITRKR
jgi:hypothetical protein